MADRIVKKLVRGTFETVVPRLDSEIFDCIVIDPPYGVDYASNKKYDDSEDSVFSNAEMWLGECHRVLKSGSHIYIFVPTKYVDRWVSLVRKFFTFKNLIATRNYTMFVNRKPIRNNFTFIAQFIIFASKGTSREFNEVDGIKKTDGWLRDKRNKSVSEYTYFYPNFITEFRANVKANHQVKKLHPNEKSVDLIQFFVEISTKERELVGDFFAGVGTTGVACLRSKRSFFLVEQNKEYCQIASKRLMEQYETNRANRRREREIERQDITRWFRKNSVTSR